MSKLHWCWISEYVRETLHKSADWEVYAIEYKGKHSGYAIDMVETKGAKCRLLKSGKRKGEKTWREKEDNAFYSFPVSAFNEWVERVHGNECDECAGEGRIPWRWSVTEGNTWKECPKCGNKNGLDTNTTGVTS